MTTPTGTITLANIQTEFGGANPIGLNEYYEGGGYVAPGVGVPTSGTLSMNDLRGKTQVNWGTLTPSIGSVNEGQSVTFNFAAVSGVADGTYYWKLTGTNLHTRQFTGGAMSGSFTVTSLTGSIPITTVADLTTEGNGSFRCEVGTVSGVPTTFVSSSYVTLVDTSLTPPPAPTVTISGPSTIYAYQSMTFTGSYNAYGLTPSYGLTIYDQGASSYLSGYSLPFTTASAGPSSGSGTLSDWIQAGITTSSGSNYATAYVTVYPMNITSAYASVTGGASAGATGTSCTLHLGASYAVNTSIGLTVQYSITGSGGPWYALATPTWGSGASSTAPVVYGPTTSGGTSYVVWLKVTAAGMPTQTFASNGGTAWYI